MTATNVQQFRQLTTDIPPIAGKELDIEKIVNHQESIFLDNTDINLEEKKALFACALHMHQPTIPAGQHGELICNLQHMFEHQGGRG